MVQDILARTGIKNGTCLILGCGDGHLAYEMVKQTDDLKVYCIDPNSERISTARKNLSKAGVYDTEVYLNEGDFTTLSYTASFADLVLFQSTTRLSNETDEQRRQYWQRLRSASPREREELLEQMQTEYRQSFRAVAAEAYRVLKPSGGVLYLDVRSPSRSSSVNTDSLRNWLGQPPFNPPEDTLESTHSWIKLTKGK